MFPYIALILLSQVTPKFEPLPGFEPIVIPSVVPAIIQEGPVSSVRVPDTISAVAWALEDILQIKEPHDRLFMRYLWIPPYGDISWHQVNSLAVNSAISRSSVPVLPDGLAGGWLIRWDLRQLAPKEHDLIDLLINWNSLFVGEQYFHVELPAGKTSKCRSYIHTDGKTYNARRFVVAPHVVEGYTILENETQCFAPLIRADDFLRRVTSTVEGGLYYHFMGFIRGGKRLTEKEIFKRVGLDVTLSRGVEGDDRAAMIQSAVTGKPRMVEQVQGAIGKGRLTYDIFDEDLDTDRHPVYELVDFVDNARGKEIIFELPNGLLGYFLVDGKGNLVDVAPPNLVSDHRTPEPMTRQLYPMISCIRCHGPNGGVQLVRNDIPILLKRGTKGGTDLFDNLSTPRDRRTVVDRLTGLYSAGDRFQFELSNSRIRYADSVFEVTRGMGVRGEEKVAVKAAEALSAQFAEYWYPVTGTTANVDPDRACLEWGHRVEQGKGTAFLQQTFKPTRVDVVIDGTPIEFTDPTLGALEEGLTIRRQDFGRIYPYGAYQIEKSRKETK